MRERFIAVSYIFVEELGVSGEQQVNYTTRLVIPKVHDYLITTQVLLQWLLVTWDLTFTSWQFRLKKKKSVQGYRTDPIFNTDPKPFYSFFFFENESESKNLTSGFNFWKSIATYMFVLFKSYRHWFQGKTTWLRTWRPQAY